MSMPGVQPLLPLQWTQLARSAAPSSGPAQNHLALIQADEPESLNFLASL
jgi:hypothetical protein